MTDRILAHKDGRIGIVTFNNPEKHNALSLEMWQRTGEILDAFAADAEVRVVVLTGAGDKAFASGADISKFASERATAEAAAIYNDVVDRVSERLYAFPKPTIAKINGYCMGGGLALAVSCDMRVASTNAVFALPAAKLGLGYGYEGLRRCMETIGPTATKEIFFTARRFGCDEAVRWGLLNRAVAPEALAATVMEIATAIADNAPLTVAAVKRITVEILKDPDARDMAACDEMVAACFASDDYKEGRAAFLEKRKPRFGGR
ncbi:MAG: enoyl-CoA hydratase/isomerase family protein [Telmatospirillum sp.]|nr:enoyl-CoA hydratase/isomerase family protein [Telmatospirillum sp.]